MPPRLSSRFSERDFITVRLHDFGDLSNLKPIDIARVIVRASDEGKKPVNFRLKDSDEYWKCWTRVDNGLLIDAALSHLGYSSTFETNPTSDGRYYFLTKKR